MNSSKQASGLTLLYDSTREGLLRVVTLICFAPVPLTAWLISLPPRPEWEAAPFGREGWWVLPAMLMALACALPMGLLYLHGRYVLRLEKLASGKLRLTTFLIWGRRTVFVPDHYFAEASRVDNDGRFVTGMSVSVKAPSMTLTPPGGRKLIFDRQGVAPQGWDVIDQLTGRY